MIRKLISNTVARLYAPKHTSKPLKPLRLVSTSHAPDSRELFEDEDHKAARKWLESFSVNSIPRNLAEISFSRSSGPGGQNVNKYGDIFGGFYELPLDFGSCSVELIPKLRFSCL